MSEKKFDAQVNYGWGLSLNMTGKAPAIAKRIFDTYADALSYANDFNDSAIEGLQLSVVNDTDPKKNGVYFLAKATSALDSNDAELVLVGSNGTGAIQVNTYEEAIAEATADNRGQIIYVTTETTSDEITYKDGPYIVIGEGKLSYLSSSEEVETLKSRVDAIDGKITELEADHENFVEKEEVETLKSRVDTIDGKIADLEGIDHSIYENKVEDIQLNGESIVTDKIVNITYNDEIATEEVDGVTSVIDGENAPTSTAVYNYVESFKSSINDLINELDGKVNAIETWELQVISEENADKDNFGVEEIDHKTIYLVPNKSEVDKNIYDEYIYLESGAWEKLGEFKADFDATGLQTAITDLGTRVDAIEAQLESITTRLDTAETDIANLKTSVSNNTTKIGTIEEKINDITSVGGEPNTIEYVAVGDVKLNPSADDKTVTIEAVSITTDDSGVEQESSLCENGKIKIYSILNSDIDNIVNGNTVE